MELIKYRKTLDVHKNGVQFLLQGFETADKLSRVIEISLMASGDAIDFPLESIVAVMYVTTPGATEPSINKCTIKDNKVVYDVLPIVEEGITTMQLKLIETSVEGAKRILASPKFAVEVSKSDTNEEEAEQTVTYTAIEQAIAMSQEAYGRRLERIELSSDCIFRAFYADETVYETDILQKLFLNGNVELSKSYAVGGTGVRAGEDTDNSKYYSNVSKSESLNAKAIMENSEDILEEVKLHGVYTAFSVDFETGTVEYVSPSFKFNVDLETGELEAEGQAYTFNDEIGRVAQEWLGKNGVVLSDLQSISETHTEEIAKISETNSQQTQAIIHLNNNIAKITKGSYVGTNKFGETNPNSLTFDFAPDIVYCFAGQVKLGNYSANLSAFLGTLPTMLLSTEYKGGNGESGLGFGTTSTATNELAYSYAKKSSDGKTIYWYNTSNATRQNNNLNTTYYYIGIKFSGGESV